VVVTRTGYSGEVGYEIFLHDATRNGMRLWDTVLEAGRPHGLEVIGPCHIRRIEAGILAYGADMWLDTNPFEVDMGYSWMVDLDQEADFVGKDALRRIKAEGPRRKLVGVEIAGPSLGTYVDNEMVDFFPVLLGDRGLVGQVTSACWSPRLEKNIGYAMLPVELAGFGAELEVETPRGRSAAVVVPKPFYDPAKAIPKQ
jgi:glycine cleavage system aminomethyltransferase T